MPNIEEILVAYPASRSGLVQRTGPSTASAPGERELFDHTNLWIPGESFQNQGLYFTALGQAGIIPVRWYPKTAEQWTHCSVRRPRKWDNGSITARIWYTGDTGDDTLDIRCALSFSLEQESAGASVAYSYFFFTLTGPATANKLYIDRQPEVDTTGAGYVVATSEYDFIIVDFQRRGDDAEDTYDDNLGLIGVELLYRPSLVESTGVPPWLMKE